MKKLIPLLFSLLFAISMLTFPANAAGDLVEISQNTPFYMTALGDSIAAGYGLEGYEADPCYTCRSYANMLAEKYELVAETNYYNLAVSGATSTDLLNSLKNDNVSRQIRNSDTIIISIGGNDMLHVLYNALGEALGSDIENVTSIDEVISSLGLGGIAKFSNALKEGMPLAVEQFEANLKLITSTIKRLNPNGIVIIQTIYNPLESFEQLAIIKELSESAINDFNKVITDNADNKDGSYIVCDIAAEFNGKADELTRIGEFDIHPNEAGHQKIYEILDKEITSHTFTTWIIDTSASNESQAGKEAKAYLNVMTGFFYMLVISVAIIGVIFIKKMKEL